MFRNFLYFLFAFLVAPVFFGSLATKADAATLLFSDDFESGNLKKWSRQGCHSHSLNVVSSGQNGAPRARSGNKLFRAEVKKGDKRLPKCTEGGGNRAEILKGKVFSIGQDTWIGYSMYVPRPADARWLTQIHGGPEPVFRLEANPSEGKGKWKWGTMNHARAGYKGGPQVLIPEKANQWVDWVIRFRPSKGGDGRIQLWMNGKLLIDDKGLNIIEKVPYFKIGTYVSRNNLVFFDNVKIAKGPNGYDLVAPSPSGSLKPPRAVQNVRLTNKTVSGN